MFLNITIKIYQYQIQQINQGQSYSTIQNNLLSIKKQQNIQIQMLKNQLSLSKMLLSSTQNHTTLPSSKYPNLIEFFKGKEKQVFNHHVLGKPQITRRVFQLQRDFRKCLTIAQVNSVYKENRALILSSQKFATIIIEFLLEFYIDPKRICFKDLQDDLQVYEFLAEYMDMTDQEGIKGFTLHDMIQLLSLLNRIFVYYNEQKRFAKWKHMLGIVEAKIFNQLKKSQHANNIAITDLHNLLIATDRKFNLRLVDLILNLLNKQINFTQQNYEFQRLAFSIIKALNQVSWKSWRQLKNIMYFIIQKASVTIDYFDKPCQIFINLSQIRLHLVGPKTLPPILKKILNQIVENLTKLPQKILYQVLNSFKLLPITFEQRNFRKLFNYVKTNLSHQTFFILSIPYRRFKADQIKQIMLDFAQNKKQVIWTQAQYLYSYFYNMRYILGQGKNLTPISKMIYQTFTIKLKQIDNIKEGVYAIANLIRFANMLDQKKLTTKDQRGRQVSFSYLIGVKIVQIFIQYKKSIKNQSLTKEQFQSKELRFFNRLLMVLPIRNIMTTLKILNSIKHQKFDSIEIEQQMEILFARILGIISIALQRKSSKILFSSFQQQVLYNLEQNVLISSCQIVNRITIFLVCYLILDRHLQKQEYNILFQQHQGQNNITLSSIQKNSQIHVHKKLKIQQIKFRQIQIQKMLQKIKNISYFDHKLYFKIILICLKSPEYNRKNQQNFFNKSQRFLVQILLQKLPRNQQIILIETFILLQERNKFLCKHMIELLCSRNTCLKNMLTLVGSLTLEQLKSAKGTIIVDLAKYLNKLVTKKAVESVVDDAMKKEKYYKFIDIKTLNMAVLKLSNFAQDQTIKKLIKQLVLEYLKYFPLPKDYLDQFDSTYDYNDAFDILRVSSQVLTFDCKFRQTQINSQNKIEKLEEQFQKNEPDKLYIKQEQNSNSLEDQKYSLSGQKRNRRKNISAITHQRAQKIYSITKKLINSIQKYGYGIALDQQKKNRRPVFNSIRHLLRQFQIQNNLLQILEFSIEKQNNLIDQIILYQQNNRRIQFHNDLQSQLNQDSVIVQEQLHTLNCQLVILRAFCSDKLKFQDYKTELINLIKSLETLSKNRKITSNHLRSAFSILSEPFIADMNKIYNYPNASEQAGQTLTVNCKERFNIFLLPIIQNVSLNKAKIFQSSQYLIQILVGMNKATKQNFSSSCQKILAYYKQMSKLQKDQNYKSRMMKFRYRQAIKTLIINLPEKWSAHQTKILMKCLDQSAIFDTGIMQHLARQIRYSSFYLNDCLKQILYFFARANFSNILKKKDINNQVDLYTKLVRESKEIIQQQLQKFQQLDIKRISTIKDQKDKIIHLLSFSKDQQILLGRYPNYIWAIMASQYSLFQKQSDSQLSFQLKTLVKLQNNQILKSYIIIFVRDIIGKISSIRRRATQNKHQELFFQINFLEIMFAKLYQFILIMTYCLRNLNQKNFQLYPDLKMNKQSIAFMLDLSKILVIVQNQSNKLMKIDVQRQITKVLRQDALKVKSNDFQRYLKSKKIEFHHCYAMKMPKAGGDTVQTPVYDYFFDYYLPEQKKVIMMIRPRFLDYSSKYQTGQLKVNILIAKLYIFMINRGLSPENKIKLAIYDARKLYLKNIQSYQLQEVVQDQKTFISKILNK